MRTSSLLLFATFFIGVLLVARTAVNAQTVYITVYGRLVQFQCPIGAVSGPCTGFSLTTNGTTPGIPDNPMLDFSQSVVPAPAQRDVGQFIMVTGYYGQESPCTLVNSCPAFFVHTWEPYTRDFTVSIPTGTSNAQTFPDSVIVYFAIVLVTLLGSLAICGNKYFRLMKR